MRVAYLQPAELRPGLLEVIAGTDGVAPYFDLSFQHSSPTLLRRMRRFGGTDDFLQLIERARALAPAAGFRTNVILGFPGETEDDVAELERFLTEGRLDAVGVFGYSDEEGTEAMGLPGKLDQAEIDARVRRITDLVEELTAQRAEDRIGERVEVLLTEDLPPRRARACGWATPPTRTPTPTGRPPSPGCPPAPSPGSSWPPRWSAPRAWTWSRPRAWSPPPARPVGDRRDRVAPDPAATPPQTAQLVNLPNALTVLRLAVVPVFAVLLLQDQRAADDAGRYWATLVFALAIITDRYDGMIARRTGQVTEFGKLADPIADKALTGTALIGLSVLELLPWWVTAGDPRPRGRRHPAALLGDPARRDRRQPRRQGQDRRPVAGDRALHPAADRAAGQRPLVGDGVRGGAHRGHRPRLRLPGADPAPDQRPGHARPRPARRAAGPPGRAGRAPTPPPEEASARGLSARTRDGGAAELEARFHARSPAAGCARNASYCRRAATQSPAAWCASISAR